VNPSGISDHCASRSASSMIRLPNAPGSLPTPSIASVTMPMHYFVGTALATFNTRLSSCREKSWPRLKRDFAVVVAVLTEWSSLIVRWLHVVAGIAWIGSSFYFIHLDLSLKPRSGLPPGVQGDAWQVHGGGFYHMVKYLIAPARMPDELTWFKWGAYTTWLSGFALLVIVYYLG